VARGSYAHRREALFVDRRYYVLCDRVRGEGEADWTLGMDIEGKATSTPDGRRLVVGGYLVVLAGPTDCALKLVKQDDAAPVRSARMVAATRGSDVRFLLLVYPLRGECADEVTVEPLARGNTSIGFILRRPGGEDLVGFAHGDHEGLGGLPPCSEAAALSRPSGATSAPWRRLFELREEAP
jgi:hypothetical protein